jgi:hypothetical protein
VVNIQQIAFANKLTRKRGEPRTRLWLIENLPGNLFTHAARDWSFPENLSIQDPYSWAVGPMDFDENTHGTCSHVLTPWECSFGTVHASLRCEFNVVVVRIPIDITEDNLEDKTQVDRRKELVRLALAPEGAAGWTELLDLVLAESPPLDPLPRLAWEAESIAQKNE